MECSFQQTAGWARNHSLEKDGANLGRGLGTGLRHLSYCAEPRASLWFRSLWQKSPSHHNRFFDLNVAEKCSRGGTLKAQNYVPWNSGLKHSVCWKCRLPGHFPTFDVNLDFTNAPENEVRLWTPSSCRHLGTGRDNNNMSVLWESLIFSCGNTGSGWKTSLLPAKKAQPA